MTSTRLPGKVLKNVNGIPLLKYHLDRLKIAGLPVFVATTTNKSDDGIIKLCEQEKVETFRGDEFNVLERYYFCAKKYRLDIIVRVTSDCPLIDSELIQQGVDRYLQINNKKTYLSNTMERSFPRGVDFEIFHFEMLKKAYENATLELEKEHVTPYFYQNDTKSFDKISLKNKKNNDAIRITVDTNEDFDLIKVLIENYQAHKKNTAEIVKLFEENPELGQMNEHIEQKKLKDA